MTGYRPRSRRDVLKVAGVAGIAGIAGCLGDDDDDDDDDDGVTTDDDDDTADDGDDDDAEYTITIAGAASGSSTQAAGQALALAASQHSDTLTIDVQETGGWTANMYEFDDGEFSTIGVDNNSWAAAINGDPPFDDDPVENMPMQGYLFTSLEMHWVAMDGSGIESTADLRDGGYTIYPIEPGFGTRLLTETVLQEDGIWDANEINNEDTDDIPGAVEEGRVDALAMYGANGVDLAGWCQEVDVRSDGQLYLIDVDQQFEDAVDAVPGATPVRADPYPYQQDVTSHLGLEEDIFHWALQGQWAYGPDVEPEAVYEMARISLEHHDTARDSDPTTLEYTPEIMASVFMDDVPVHPGMVDFLEDHDAWDPDQWEAGEI